MLKKVSVSGAFARKEPYSYDGKDYDADIKSGDTVRILNSGDIVSGEYGEQHVFSISTRNGDKNIALNQSSINALIDELGDESQNWVGKEVQVSTKKDVVAGKRVIIAYLHPATYALNEWGDLEKVERAVNLNGTPKPAYPEYTGAPNFDGSSTALKDEDVPF